MKGYGFLWRMTARRKDACLLVLLFTTVVTAFMLTYPHLMEETGSRLREAYEKIEVKGWVFNGSGYDEPEIPGEDWHVLLDSRYFERHASYATLDCGLYSKETLEKRAKGSSGEARLRAFQLQLADVPTTYKSNEKLRAASSFETCDDLMRLRDELQWLDGYSEDCLESSQHICILSEKYGYAPGETIPVLVERKVGSDSSQRISQIIIRLKVVATYPGYLEYNCVMPLNSFEQLCRDATTVLAEEKLFDQWEFSLSSFDFIIKDNRQMDEMKQLFTQLGYDCGEGHGLRIAIDDRILQDTVAPIESNLALLEGLYRFFFLVVAAIGFFLCFLLVRSRKAEYAVMRMLGESTKQITWKVLTEQSVLCALGIGLGAFTVLLSGWGEINPLICALILLCYSLGAAVAVWLTVRVNVMEILVEG